MRSSWKVVTVLFLAVGVLGAAPTQAEDPAKEADSVLDFTVKNIQGKEVNLKDYKGNVLLIVNVASECGLTPQYDGLEKLYAKYKDQGLRILAFPCNDFGAQEPGTEEQIAAFCKTEYGVTFDLFSKVKVKGEEKAPLYDYLTSEKTNGEFAGEIQWNFQKYLVDREGNVIARFDPKVKPDDEALVAKLVAALADK